MPSVSLASRCLYDKDAEVLARVAQLPFAALGSVRPHPFGIFRVRLGFGRPMSDHGYQGPLQEVMTLVQRFATPQNSLERDSTNEEIKIEAADGSQQAVAWVENEHCLVATLFPLLEATPFVALVNSGEGPEFRDWQRKLARLALLQQSECLRRPMTTSGASEAEVLSSVLDRLTIPMTVVDRMARVIYKNAAARWYYQCQGGLLLSARQIVSSPDADTHRRLHLAVQAVTNGADSKSQVLLLPKYRIRQQRRQPIVVVSALPPLGEFALLAYADGQQDSEMVRKVVSELGLTSAEQRLACQLVVGDCLEDAAEHLSIRVSTARSYLRSIFGKTGASRQSELVAMVLSLALPISLADLKVVDCSTASETALEHGGHRLS